MIDPHLIVDQIRAVLHAGDPARNGRLAGLASAYAEACHEVTQRLGRCHRLLQQGLRSEAIQLAESEPNLLEAAAALDFPERAEWDGLVQRYELTAAARVPIEPARRLNEAYAEQDPLQDLLRRHRRLALQRGPLRSRIGVLRQLAAQDSGNSIWGDDLRGFEGARWRQIGEEAAEAVRYHDGEAIARLVAEVEQPGWVEPPPRALVQSLRKADEQMRGDRARAELEGVLVRLHDAWNARDPIRGRPARQQWARLAGTASLPRDDPLAERARPVLDWLDEEDRRDRESRQYEAALSDLVRALDYPGAIPSAELERLAHAVRRNGQGLPDGLQHRYISRLRLAEEAQARRSRITAAALAAGLLLTGVLVYAVFRSQARASQAEQAATSIGDLIELGELDRATGLLRRLEAADPGILADPRLVAVRERVEVVRGQEAERALQFDQAMRQAEAAPASVQAPPALATARARARLETEKAALDRLVQRRAAALQAAQARLDKELSPRLDEVGRALDRLERRVEAVEPDPDQADAAVFGALADSQRALAGLGPDLAAAGEAVQGRARSLDQRLDALRSRLAHRHRQARLEEAITAVVADSPASEGVVKASELAAGLQAFLTEFPRLPRSSAFATTLKEQTLWEAVAAWSRLTAGWTPDRAGLSPQEAKIRAEQCRRFLVQHPGSPDADRATSYQRAMEAIARRGAAAEAALGKLRRLLTDILVDHLWMVMVKPPAAKAALRYYLTEPHPRDARSIRYLVGFDGKERTAQVVADWIEWSGVAPQSEVAAAFKPVLFQDPARIDWEVALIDLVDRIRIQPGMDPVLRLALLRKVLVLAVEGSEPLRATLEDFKNVVDQADVDVNVPWMDPDHKEAEPMRTQAARVVRSLPDPIPWRKAAVDRRTRLELLVAHRPRTVGWLAHEADGWRVRTGSVVPPRGALWVVLPKENSRGAWRQVGAIDGGTPRLSRVDDPALAEGRPVFLTGTEPAGP